MRRIDELTESELCALTDENLAIYIDMECAVKGVPFLPLLPQVPVLEKPDPDLVLFQIPSFFVASAEEAASVMDAISKVIPWRTEGYGDTQRGMVIGLEDSYYQPKPETIRTYSVATYEASKNVIREYGTAKKCYEAEKKEYDKASDAREDSKEYVYDIVRDAKTKAATRASMRAEFERYLGLAEGNKTIAMNFLTKARPTIKTDYPELMQELCPGYTMSEE